MVTNPCNVNNPWLRGEQFYGVESVPNIIHCLNGHAHMAGCMQQCFRRHSFRMGAT